MLPAAGRLVMPPWGGRGTFRTDCDGMLRVGPALLATGLGKFRTLGPGTLRGLFDAIAGFDPRPGPFGVTREGAPVSVRPAKGF